MTVTEVNAPGSVGGNSYVRDAVAPTYDELRPMKKTVTNTFPVYRPDELMAAMLAERQYGDPPDPTVAQVLATCASYAYSDAVTVSTMMARLGFEGNHCREISKTVDAMFIRSTAFLVQSHDGRVVIVCYRGTPPLDLLSYLTDADTESAQMTTSGDSTLSVHGGFYRNMRITRPEVITALECALEGRSVLSPKVHPAFAHQAESEQRTRAARHMKPLEALYITGHSLGGAMAVLLATTVAMTESEAYGHIADKLRGVYTLGQPMVADGPSASAMDLHFQSHVRDGRTRSLQYVRHVYRHDVVPHLPSHDTGDFAHFGNEFRYGSHTGWRPSPEPTRQMRNVIGIPTALAAFVAQRLRPVRWVPFRYSFDDHTPNRYLPALVPPGKPNEFGEYYSVNT